MQKRTIAWIAIGVTALITLAVGAWAAFGTHRVTLSRELIQEKIDGQLPKEVKKGFTVKSVKVDMEGNLLRVIINTYGEKFGKEFSLAVETIGVPDYDRSSGSFYFRPEQVKVGELTFQGTPLSERYPSNKLEALAERYITNQGIKNAVKDAAPLVEKAEKKLEGWVSEYAEAAAIKALNRVPVYRLADDLRGTIARASLDSVSVEGKNLVVQFSLIQLTLWVGMMLLGLLAAIALAIAMLNNPGWGLALEAVGGVADILS